MSALDPLWFRRRVAMVGQEPVLFGCSIAENISYGKKSTQEEVHRRREVFFLSVCGLRVWETFRSRMLQSRRTHTNSSCPLR